ncbi:MAG: aminotransferase class V-fold PLP-dependent enzyme [Oscillospiraceae bacterium]|nr:aminotransferase class V-fold PLP-dependent enzyme [Oscillospiraceae bacterium]
MIYLDAAATTLQKPSAVSRAVCRALREQTSPGRGGHSASMKAADVVWQCREIAARFFSVKAPEQIVFTMNATHGLNVAIKSLVGPGDRVVVSSFEHNSVIRPLHRVGADLIVARSPLFDAPAAVAAYEAQITPETKLVVLNHASNVFGYVLPAMEIARICKARGVAFLLDASQSAGALPIDATALGADFIAMPGHKGLYGPQGTGLLICKHTPTTTLIEGGTGSDATRREMPDHLPDRLEAGTPNMPGINGLLAGLRFVERRQAQILQHERALTQRLIEGLRQLPNMQLYAAQDSNFQIGVLSLNLAGIDCETIAAALDEQGVAVRAGLHCAPLAHESAGTLEIGTVRISVSAFNTSREVDAFLRILEKIGKNLRKSERNLH